MILRLREMALKKNRLGMIVILLLGIAIILFSKKEILNAYFSTVKLQFLTNYTSTHYLYDVEEQTGIEGIYSGYLNGLNNSVTYYLEQDDLKAARVQAAGNYYGVGLELMWNLDGQSLTVINVIKDSPADREGIQVGDLITEVGGIKVLPANKQMIITTAFSNASKPIQFTIESDHEVTKVSLTPEEVMLEDVTLEHMDEVLYIKLNTIKDGTSARLGQMIDAIATSLYKGIILDVRGLSTDNLQQVSKISDLFLDEGIAFKVKSKAEEITVFKTNNGAYDTKVAVLMNSETLGGAEALVLALKGYATLYGSNTGGLFYTKDIVAFEDGTGMSVASGKICDRYGKQLLEEGVVPDIRLYLDEEDQINRFVNGYLTRQEDSYLEAVLEKFQ